MAFITRCSGNVSSSSLFPGTLTGNLRDCYMKIIILGANQVGSTLAETLANEQNDITVVDTDVVKLRELKDRIDIGTITGMASHPDILEQAGGEDADMIIAVTESDEINMVACRVAFSLFHTPKKICRLRSSAYLVSEKLFGRHGLAVDDVISPEQRIQSIN